VSAAEDAFAGTSYRVVRPLGRGGMGEVFLVEHREMGRELVAKLLHQRFSGDAQMLDRVRVEAHSLARLEQPNVVQVTDFDNTRDGRPFIVMEYLLGRTVKDELKLRGAFSLLDTLDFVHQALSGLAAAHALGVVHRDVKPENLFLSEEGDGTITLKLLDFGIARVIRGFSPHGPAPLALPTETGAVIGTLRYLSPEAALGKHVDQRADLYSLALVFYEMLAGVGPFEHLKHDFLTAHTVEDPKRPSHFSKGPIPAEVEEVVLKALRKNPDERYQTAEEFQAELERLWGLVNKSQALATTVFAPHDVALFRTTGGLRRQAGASRAEVSSAAVLPGEQPTAPFVASGEVPNATFGATHAELGRRRPALIIASVIVALVTAVALTGIIIALASRFLR